MIYYSNGWAYDLPEGSKPEYLPKQNKPDFEKQRNARVAEIIALTGYYEDTTPEPLADNTPPQAFIDAEVAKYNDAKAADRAKANALLVKAGLTEADAEGLISFLKN